MPAAAHDRLDAGASERLVRAARAAEQLCAALWEALHEELRCSPADLAGVRVVELAERLAQVCGSLVLLARSSASAASERAGACATVGEAAAAPLPEPPASAPEIAIRDTRGVGPS